MYDYCSFCRHCEHFGKCEECDCPRDHMPSDQWETWLTNRDEKSGQLIECVNPEHKNLGSIHYIQPDCVKKMRIWLLWHSDYENSGVYGIYSSFTEANEAKKRAAEIVDDCKGGRNLFIGEHIMGEDRFIPLQCTSDSDESWQASEALLKR